MIVFCTTCKGRAEHIERTLPENIANNKLPDSKFVLLNYNSPDHLLEFIVTKCKDHLKSGKLVLYNYPAEGPFHVSHAKNIAARLGIREGADILVTLDADNFTGPDFDKFVANQFKEQGIYLTPNYEHIQSLPHGPERPLRGFAGRLAVRAQEFIKAGGYNEVYDTWRGEDIDFNARMGRMGYVRRFIDNKYLGTIPHNAAIRFKEYPHARQFEAQGSWRIAGNETSTVVNNGRFGLGTVFKNFERQPINLNPIATRVFGIGLHKTATTSLHKAFQILGFDSLHWGKGEAPAIWEEMHTKGRSITVDRFYSLCDLPIPLLYEKLDKAYPGSKFILTKRDETKWLTSVKKLWDSNFNPTRHLWEIYPFSHKIHTALYGQRDFDPLVFLERYRRHNAEVIAYFKDRQGDLLVMDMEKGAGWKELCTFLEIKIPGVPYPIEYVTRQLELSC
jgi:hypothetical protein